MRFLPLFLAFMPIRICAMYENSYKRYKSPAKNCAARYHFSQTKTYP